MVADRKLLLLAICCLSQWTLEQIVATYTLSDAECVRYLRAARPARHHRAAAAQPLPAEGRQDLPLAARTAR